MFAIIHKTSKQFVTGTDYRRRYTNGTCLQITSNDKALTYRNTQESETDMLVRRMSDKYKIVEVELKVKE